MEKFVVLRGVAAPLSLINVNTDLIIPKQFLKSPSRLGYGPALFHDLRFHPDGRERDDFVLNLAPYREAKILVAGENFGCGSSREHAAWAIAQYGIRCIIAPSFADVFTSNCYINSILPIVLPRRLVDQLSVAAANPNTCQFSVDLDARVIGVGDGTSVRFDIDAHRRNQLMQGLDAIGITLSKVAAISAFEMGHWNKYPWLSAQAIHTSPRKVISNES